MSHVRSIVCLLAAVVLILNAGGNPARADSGNCAGFSTVVSIKCMYGSWTGQRYGGGLADWNSAALNITESAAHSGQFIAEAMWFTGIGTSATTYLKVGITGGTSTMIGNANQWQRWYYYVDATVPGTIQLNGIIEAPNDNISRHYQLEAFPDGSGQWSVLAGCDPACWGVYVWWADPNNTTVFNNTLYMVGLEVTPGVMNSSSNAPTFNDHYLGAINWVTKGGELPAYSAQVDRPCSLNSVPFCLNGNGTGTNWDNNKPN
jgi:hypothetical protein